MANLTLSGMRSFARLLAQDTSTTNPGLSDANLNDLLNDAYHMVWTAVVRRPVATADVARFADAALSATTGVFLDVLQVFREANNTDKAKGPLLERMPSHRLIDLQNTQATKGTPSRYSIERAATTTVADQTKWIVRLHPIPDNSGPFNDGGTLKYVISGMTVGEPQTMTTDGQAPDVTEEQAFQIARIVAVTAASLLGRPEKFIQEISGPLPERFQVFARRLSEVVPRKRPQETLT